MNLGKLRRKTTMRVPNTCQVKIEVHSKTGEDPVILELKEADYEYIVNDDGKEEWTLWLEAGDG